MTHDPRLPTTEQIMDGYGRNPLELIETQLGKMERWRAEAMLIGTTGGIQSVYNSIRSDSAAQAARADEAEARATLIRHVCDKITDFEKRFDALEARLTAAEDRRRADEARQRRLDEEEIELPPDLDRVRDLPPSKIGDATDPGPSGELHTVAAKSEPPEPSLADPKDRDDTDNIGDLPKELAEPSDPVPEPKGSVLPPPTALFGN